MLRGRSSPLEVVIETSTTSASCPWNLSIVPTRRPGGSTSTQQIDLRRCRARRRGCRRASIASLAAVLVDPPLRDEALRRSRAPRRPPPGCAACSPRASTGMKADAGRTKRRMRRCVQHEPPARVGRLGREPAVVDRIRDEAAHVLVHAPGRRQEDAAIRRHRRLPVEQVVERGLARAARVHALDRLAELHLVAEQHEVARARWPSPRRLASDTWPASSTKR